MHGIVGSNRDWEKTAQTLVGDDYYKIHYTNQDFQLSTLNLPIEISYQNEPVDILDDQFRRKTKEQTKASVWLISYYTSNLTSEIWNGDLTLYAHRISNIIECIKVLTGKDKVILVGHSMGGLIARKFMTLHEKYRSSVHKILTVASPHEGVQAPLAILGHFIDLQNGSDFFRKLNRVWNYDRADNRLKWGVTGAINPKAISNFLRRMKNKTDSGGMGFVTLSSVFPFGEWEESIQYPDQEKLATKNFSYRLFTYAHHEDLLYHRSSFQGIRWALLDIKK